jgi:radical SAM superfamily enzyme YgiQ (UPF0313 family)
MSETDKPLTPFPALPAINGTAPTFSPLGSEIKALMVWPRFPPSFWGFEGMLEILPEKSVMPPLGLITVAALCPRKWQLRLVDCAFESLTDDDLKWADLVMVSAMFAQQADARRVLSRARSLGRRTFIGGPWACSQPEVLVNEADHVLVGEAEDSFSTIAAELENGTARRLYVASKKPDMTRSPLPRYDLLKLNRYACMSVQFSRGCPFQCEFCDIITIYGRRPRVKAPAQVLSELEALRALGWHKEVFVVDDNFIGNHARALELVREMAAWQRRNAYPFYFFTEASIDLSERPELLAAMREANFLWVFIGVETPSPESLNEARKFQNLRGDNFRQIRRIQRSGLWVMGGFIVGFDADDERIFERQRRFIENAAIPWAMVGMLQAPPTTPLYDRMLREGRLIQDSDATTNFSIPNFHTRLPLPILLDGMAALLLGLYDPAAFLDRALRSLIAWRPSPMQRFPRQPAKYMVRLMALSICKQGILGNYRGSYWRFWYSVARLCRKEPAKLGMAFLLLLSAHHFPSYARLVAAELAAARRERFSDRRGLALSAPGGPVTVGS